MATVATSNTDDYPFELIRDAEFYRPSTSNPFRSPFKINDPIGVSHYDHEFYGKRYSKRELIRAGSATGTRNNQPQPTKEFLAWRYKPERPIVNPNSNWSKPLTEETIREAMKSQLKSVYTNDYADIMRRVELAKLNEQQQNKNSSRSLQQLPNIQQQHETTESRLHYQKIYQPDVLRNPTTRFGSRK